MLRLILIIIFLNCFGSLFGQAVQRDLSKIKTVSEAEAFIENHPQANGKIFTIKSSTDTSEILLPLYNKKSGFAFTIGNDSYKVLLVDSVLCFRVYYIYLNGEQLSKTKSDSLRQEIISSYKNGASFFDLAQQYNMDGNVSGDTGWFTENMMVKEFETAVRSHKRGDIFTVDTPSKNWYHVVLKTYDDTFIKKATILMIKSGGQ